MTEMATRLPAGAEWVSRVPEYQNHPYFYSHASDFLRDALLFLYGGTYADSDMILVRPLDGPDGSSLPINFMGTEFCSGGLDWCVNLPLSESKGFFVGEQPDMFTLNPAFMKFQSPGHSFLRAMLRLFDSDYDPERWGCNPYFSTLVATRFREQVLGFHSSMAMSLYKPSAFNPIPWWNIKSAFSEPQRELWQLVKENSIAIHLFNKASNGLVPLEGSLASKALTEYALNSKYALVFGW